MNGRFFVFFAPKTPTCFFFSARAGFETVCFFFLTPAGLTGELVIDVSTLKGIGLARLSSAAVLVVTMTERERESLPASR